MITVFIPGRYPVPGNDVVIVMDERRVLADEQKESEEGKGREEP